MRTGDEERVSGPVSTASGRSKPPQALAQQGQRFAHGGDDRGGKQLRQIARHHAGAVTWQNIAQVRAWPPGEQIADQLARCFTRASTQNKGTALDVALKEHACERMIAAKIFRADAHQQRAVGIMPARA